MTTGNPGQPRRAIVGYDAAHHRLRAWRGRASTMRCVDCGKPARHWAYTGGDPNELHDSNGRAYSLDFERYVPKCVPCHFRRDWADADGRPVDVCPSGHSWAEHGRVRSRPASRSSGRRCVACDRDYYLRRKQAAAS